MKAKQSFYLNLNLVENLFCSDAINGSLNMHLCSIDKTNIHKSMSKLFFIIFQLLFKIIIIIAFGWLQIAVTFWEYNFSISVVLYVWSSGEWFIYLYFFVCFAVWNYIFFQSSILDLSYSIDRVVTLNQDELFTHISAISNKIDANFIKIILKTAAKQHELCPQLI